MRGGTVQINWHEQQPVLTLDFHPVSRRLATGGSDHDIKVSLHPPPLLHPPARFAALDFSLRFGWLSGPFRHGL